MMFAIIFLLALTLFCFIMMPYLASGNHGVWPFRSPFQVIGDFFSKKSNGLDDE